MNCWGIEYNDDDDDGMPFFRDTACAHNFLLSLTAVFYFAGTENQRM
jgi:hypothetical protein